MDENEGDGDGDMDNDGDGDGWLRISSDLRLPRVANRSRTFSHTSIVAVLGTLEGGVGTAVGRLGAWGCGCGCCTPLLTE